MSLCPGLFPLLCSVFRLWAEFNSVCLLRHFLSASWAEPLHYRDACQPLLDLAHSLCFWLDGFEFNRLVNGQIVREIAFSHYSAWLCHYRLILHRYWLMQPVKTQPAGCNAVVEMCKIFHSKFTPLMGGMLMVERGREEEVWDPSNQNRQASSSACPGLQSVMNPLVERYPHSLS